MHLYSHTARPIKTFPSSSSWLYDSRRHLSVLIAQVFEAEASAAGLTSYLILSIKVSHPHLMPPLCYRRTDHNYSPVCQARQRQPPQLFSESSSLTSKHTQTIPSTYMQRGSHMCTHMQAYTARLAWQWQMIRCSDTCYHGDSKARDLRWECDFHPSVLSLVILFLYGYYSFINHVYFLHPLRGKKEIMRWFKTFLLIDKFF